DVGRLVCRKCPMRDACQASGYYSQFGRAAQLVGTTEMLFSGTFLRGAKVVVLDDPDLRRAMVDVREITAATALRLAADVLDRVTCELLTVIRWAIDSQGTPRDGDRAAPGAYGAHGFEPPLIGPHAWDALARAAGSGARLAAMVRALPDPKDVLPSRND